MSNRKTLSDLYDEYKLRHNNFPKYDFGHFIRVMAMYEHHRTIIRPRIRRWEEIREVDKSVINPKMIRTCE